MIWSVHVLMEMNQRGGLIIAIWLSGIVLFCEYRPNLTVSTLILRET